MTIEHLKPNINVKRPIFSEPAQIITTLVLGDSVEPIEKGLQSGPVSESILNGDHGDDDSGRLDKLQR